MEYKICENCGAKLHARTLKCPECNTLLTDASIIHNDENNMESINQDIGENIDIQISDTEMINSLEKEDITQDQTHTKNTVPSNVKDYVYKAEVRHSLEYTNQLSNSVKVFLTAISMIPLIGQFLGTFLGIFFLTYDDNDRKTFGRSLLLLSIIVFILYFYSLMAYSEILTNGEFINYLNNFVK